MICVCYTGDGIDPRLVATGLVKAGSIVLTEDEMPENLSHSENPNCELVEQDDGLVLVALNTINPGEVFSVALEDDDEYEEWELDKATGLMTKVGDNN